LVRPTLLLGIGRSKTEAKIANHFAKKNKYFGGVCNLVHMDQCSAETLLAQVDVSDGLGRWQAELQESSMLWVFNLFWI
jgi:hypothetical protein